jgi:hypothetical protein
MRIHAKHKRTQVGVELEYETLKEAMMRTQHYLYDYQPMPRKL